MKKRIAWLALIACLSAGSMTVRGVQAGEPGWSMQVIATGEFREEIQSKPIELRPYRPLHFYGNAIRRRHYRGTALPLPRPVVESFPTVLTTPGQWVSRLVRVR